MLEVQDWRSLPPYQKEQLLSHLQTKQGRRSLAVQVEESRREDELRRCADDVVYFCDAYVKTYDPRKSPAFIPFTLFDRQKELLLWLSDRRAANESGLVEKSRDSGLTWLCCVYAVHQWIFRDAVSIGFGSRKLELVDKVADPDSILEKCRIILRNLPEWLLPSSFDVTKHAGFCKILNPATGATITGEGGDNIGRGGRKTIFFLDEAAFIEHPHLVDAALSQTTNCCIHVSTPNGSGNAFYRRRFSGKLPVFTFHWRDDPRKGEAWYAKQKEELDPVTVAQEIDIDYTASIEGIVIPASWVKAAINLKLPASGRKIGGYDVADEGANKNVLIARQGPVVYGVKHWRQMNTTQSAHRSADESEKLGVEILNYDVVGVGAGIKGAYSAMERQIGFKLVPINTGDSPTDTRWPDNESSKDKFINLRAEGWWTLRRRFEKTYEYVTQEIKHPVDELISVPNEPELIAQLSQPLWFRTETGKIKIEAKDQMRKRGVHSPDYADALVMAFIPAPSMEIKQWNLQR